VLRQACGVGISLAVRPPESPGPHWPRRHCLTS